MYKVSTLVPLGALHRHAHVIGLLYGSLADSSTVSGPFTVQAEDSLGSEGEDCSVATLRDCTSRL